MSRIATEDMQISLDQCGGNVRAAASRLGLKYKTFYYHVKKKGLIYKNLKPEIPKERLESLYATHQSLSSVATLLGCSKEGVRLAMRRYGLNVNLPTRYEFDEAFWSRDDELSLYWAGFIAADGCVISTKKKRDVVSVGLGIKDKIHLETFKAHMNATAPIHTYLVKNSKRNPKWKDKQKCELRLVSKVMCQDLVRFNVVPRKTKIYTFPEWIVTHPLCHHFMRGYFDGDGSWYIGPSKKTPQVCFSLRGTPKFLNTYRSVLERQCVLPYRNGNIRINGGIGALEYGGNGVAGRIASYIYKDATVFLRRKECIAARANWPQAPCGS